MFPMFSFGDILRFKFPKVKYENFKLKILLSLVYPRVVRSSEVMKNTGAIGRNVTVETYLSDLH